MLELLFLGSAVALVITLVFVMVLIIRVTTRPQLPKGSIAGDLRRRSSGALSDEYLKGLVDD